MVSPSAIDRSKVSTPADPNLIKLEALNIKLSCRILQIVKRPNVTFAVQEVGRRGDILMEAPHEWLHLAPPLVESGASKGRDNPRSQACR